MPKLLINAAGDQFFQPDSWQFYWNDLQEKKFLRYVPNAGHSLEDTDAVETMIAFYKAVLDHDDLPDFSWSIDNNRIHLEINPGAPLAKIKLWKAVNREERDFRVSVIGEAWQDSTLKVSEDGEYDITLSAPEKGWKAFFVEMTYNYRLPFKLTTGIKVLPERHPYPAFESPDPKGTRD
jgi:PhoPQ-activated pathogenicity-related protein